MIRDIPSKDTTGYLQATIDNQTLSWDNVKEIIKQYTQIVNYHNVSVPLYSPISIDMFLFTTGVYESETDTENIEVNEPDNENIEAPNDTDDNDDEEIDTFDDVSLDIGIPSYNDNQLYYTDSVNVPIYDENMNIIGYETTPSMSDPYKDLIDKKGIEKGLVHITINNSFRTYIDTYVPFIDGIIKTELDNILPLGDYILTVQYDGNKYYKSTTYTTAFSVEKRLLSCNFISTDFTGYPGHELDIQFYLTDNITTKPVSCNIIYNFNDIDYLTSSNSNGKCQFNITIPEVDPYKCRSYTEEDIDIINIDTDTYDLVDTEDDTIMYSYATGMTICADISGLNVTQISDEGTTELMHQIYEEKYFDGNIHIKKFKNYTIYDTKTPTQFDIDYLNQGFGAIDIIINDNEHVQIQNSNNKINIDGSELILSKDDEDWNHITIVVENNNFIIYVDGIHEYDQNVAEDSMNLIFYVADGYYKDFIINQRKTGSEDEEIPENDVLTKGYAYKYPLTINIDSDSYQLNNEVIRYIYALKVPTSVTLYPIAQEGETNEVVFDGDVIALADEDVNVAYGTIHINFEDSGYKPYTHVDSNGHFSIPIDLSQTSVPNDTVITEAQYSADMTQQRETQTSITIDKNKYNVGDKLFATVIVEGNFNATYKPIDEGMVFFTIKNKDTNQEIYRYGTEIDKSGEAEMMFQLSKAGTYIITANYYGIFEYKSNVSNIVTYKVE